MSEPIIINGIAKLRGKDAEWEFHRVLTPMGFKWYGRKSGDDKPVTALTGHKLKAAEATYVAYLEQHQGVPPPPVSVEEEPEFTPQDLKALEELGINNDTIMRPDFLRHDYTTVMGGPIPEDVIVGRVHKHGLRFYMFVKPNGDPMSANRFSKVMSLPGVTSIISQTTPVPPSLIEWKSNYPGGLKAANEYTEYRASLGTMMHHVFALIQNGTCPALDSPEWHDMIDKRLHKDNWEPRKHHKEWHSFLCKAIMSFLKWVNDYEVEIILMEIGLVSERLGYAGQIDVVCILNDKLYEKPVLEIFPVKKPKPDRPKRQTKVLATEHGARHWEVMKPVTDSEWSDGLREWGDIPDMDTRREPNMENIKDRYVHNPRRRVKGIVDFKSGAHDYDDHHVQLGFYVPLLLDKFPNFDATGLQAYNWHPSDWNEEKVTCSYKFINQSKNLSQRRTDCLLELFTIDCNPDMGDVLDFHGTPVIGMDPKQLMKKKPFEEFWGETLHLALDLGLEIN